MSYPKMRVPEAARYLGISVSTLAHMRMRGDGPPFSKLGPRIVIYDEDDLDAWTASRKRHDTNQDEIVCTEL